MPHTFPPSVMDQFSPDDRIDLSVYVDDCACACASAFTVKDGLLNVHGRPIFDRLFVEGSLVLLGNEEIQRLPDVLAVTGVVNISDCSNLKVMPSKMYVGENLWMDEVNIRELPGTLVVQRGIRMNECFNVLSIPEGMQTTNLEAVGCENLATIADGLQFGSLNLSGTAIADLPPNLSVMHELTLRNCSKLASVPEGVVAESIDVRGCDMLFTLPASMQPVVAFTDGMLLANHWVVVPNMTAEQASMCLGRKAIEAFPHRHFKNFDRMQDGVLSIDRESKAGYARPYALGALKSDRSSSIDANFLRRQIARLEEGDHPNMSGSPIKRLK